MANWDILNKEFDKLLNNLSDSDWLRWYDRKEYKKTILSQKKIFVTKERLNQTK